MRFRAWLSAGCAAVIMAAGLAATTVPAGASTDFYTYSGTASLAGMTPGTALKTRTVAYHVVGIPLPLRAVQILYRASGPQGEATTNVTSVIEPPVSLGPVRAVSYQSAYDSLNPADEPSRAIAGDFTLGGIIGQAENLLLAPLLLQGYAVIVPDTEGQAADFAYGPVYGTNTLDSIRAVDRTSATGVGASTRIGLLGYSGGAIATDWASALAPTYAPDVNRQLIGAAEGGVLVDPAHNLPYVGGSLIWAGVAPMAIIGLTRATHVDLSPYLSAYGAQVVAKLQTASIVNVLGEYPGLTWAQLVKPQYTDPLSVPPYAALVNAVNMSTAGTPSIPMFIGQGANGVLEGTQPSSDPGIGAGDGVMVAGDVRTLARQYCTAGLSIEYTQYDALSHTTSLVPWAPQAIAWLDARFAGLGAPSNCAQIPGGNSIATI